MSGSRKALVLFLLVAVGAGTAFAQASPPPREAWPAYGLSIFVGFGTGHYYLGANGTPFLIGDVAGLGLVGGGYIYMLSSILGAASNPYSFDPATAYVGYGIVGLGVLVFVVSRVWEVVDVFGVVERLRGEGKVVVTPVIRVESNQTSVELAFNY